MHYYTTRRHGTSTRLITTLTTLNTAIGLGLGTFLTPSTSDAQQADITTSGGVEATQAGDASDTSVAVSLLPLLLRSFEFIELSASLLQQAVPIEGKKYSD